MQVEIYYGKSVDNPQILKQHQKNVHRARGMLASSISKLPKKIWYTQNNSIEEE